jgi:ABC-type sugar transport system permease subunit
MIFGMAMVMVFTQLMGTQGFIAQQIGEWMGLDYVPELLADSRFANYVVWIHMLWVGFPGNLIIWGGTFARIPTEVLESGQIDGVNWVQEFTLITIPLVWPTFALHLLLAVCGLLGSSGAVFLLTNGEFGTQTLSVWLYQQTLAGVGNPDAPVFNYMSAVGIVMTVVAVSLTFTVKRFTKKAFAGVDY